MGDGQMDYPLGIGCKALPLYHQIESRHGEGQACPKVVPTTMHYLLEMPDQGEHGEHSFDHHALVPLAPFTEFEIGGVSLTGMETHITQDDYLVFKPLNQGLKAGIVNIGGIPIPGRYQTQMIEHQAEFAFQEPAMIGFPLLSDLLVAPSLSYRVDQLDAIAVDNAQQTGFSQEGITPVLVSSQQPEEASPMGQSREHVPVVLVQPTVESPVASTFNGVQQADSHDLAGPQIGLGMFSQPLHPVIHLAKQLSDKIVGSHAILLGWFHHQHLAGTP